MGSIIIAMPKHDDANRISSTIQKFGMAHDIEIYSQASEILRITHERDYGVIICTKRLRDMSYTELAEYLPDNFKIIILTSDMSLDTYSDNVIKLGLPFKGSDLAATINLALEGYYRLRRKKKGPVKRSEEEQKVIDKAKEVLMDRNGMTEPEAFRYIQKNSMDCGRNMVESAEMIIMMFS